MIKVQTVDEQIEELDNEIKQSHKKLINMIPYYQLE